MKQTLLQRLPLTLASLALALVVGAPFLRHPDPRRGRAGHDHSELQGRRPLADHRGGQRGHGQELHRRSAREGAGDDVVFVAHDARTRSTRPSFRSCRCMASSPCPRADTIKIIPDANARQVPANDLPSRVSSVSDEIVTQVVAVKNVSAAQLVPILRPLIPQYGHLAAYPALEHADHLGPRFEREPPDAHHPAHRPDRRRSDRRGADAACQRGRGRAHDQQPVHRRRRGRRRGHAVDEDRRGRAHQQRAGQRRDLAAPAAEDARRAPRHTARDGRRHAGALPQLRGCREDRGQAARTDPGHRRGRSAGRRGRRGRRCRRCAHRRSPPAAAATRAS